MKINTSNTDRITRLIIAAALAGLLIVGLITPPASILVWIAVIILAATAFTGNCPMYNLFGINTKAKRKYGDRSE